MTAGHTRSDLWVAIEKPQPIMKPLRQATADELAGIVWWNSMSEAERVQALYAAGWQTGGTFTPSAADAWTVHKIRIEASTHGG